MERLKSALARKLHQPTNESQTGAEHVMQSRSNTAHEGGGKKDGQRSDPGTCTAAGLTWEIFNYVNILKGAGSKGHPSRL